jgi:pimeloyl-ACP methyl ester carboxylesterase
METVTSGDRVPIAFDTFGQGPPVILVHGAFGDRTATEALAHVLAPDFTAITYDRRGRGGSGDSPEYTVAKEIEDLRALIRYVGGVANVFGHSSGAILALEAAAKVSGIEKVVGYEPPYVLDGLRPRPPDDLIDQARALIAEDRRDDAATLFLTVAADVPLADVAKQRTEDGWSSFTALAHTLPYDLALCGPGQRLPAVRFAAIKVPTLVIGGGASPEWFPAAARATAESIPGARYATLDSHDHGVMAKPDALGPVLRDFFRS